MNLLKGPSEIDGKGIFSKDRIEKGEYFYEVPLDSIYKNPRARCARISDNSYVSDEKILNWVNHSCTPNCQLKLDGKKLFLVAIEDIVPGSEITVDYDKTENKSVKVKCNCKSDRCRKHFFIS